MKPLSEVSESKAVLVVDDQEQNLKIVGTVLKMTGYDVIPARSAQQAFQRLEARTPDLILLDVLMPEMDGLEACRKLKADPRWAELPVIFLSAADDKNLIVQALECGGVDYVTKPFNKAELLSRVRTHLALKQAKDDLRKLAEDKDEMLGILTHDLQNHLSGMQLSAELLHGRLDEIPARNAPLIANIVQSAATLLDFVQEFLANQAAERQQLDLTSVDLHDMIEDAAEKHLVAAMRKKISLIAAESQGPAIATADHQRLTQVIDNLVTNALKFSPEGRSVTLCTSSDGNGWVNLTVKDEGPGFTDEDKKKMFVRYTRLSAHPTAGEPSTGLGLSIVKRLVDGMRGTIHLESESGKGACFTVKLPAAGASLPPISEPENADEEF